MYTTESLGLLANLECRQFMHAHIRTFLQIEHHQLSPVITLQLKDMELMEIKQNYPSDG
jgi:hypothetical protein